MKFFLFNVFFAVFCLISRLCRINITSMKKIPILLSLLCVLIFINTPSAFSKNHSSSLDLLAKHLKNKGYETASLFSHPKFEIYENIDSFFKNSAESKGISPYNEALKKGDRKEAKRVLNEEYAKYKERIGYDRKTKDMPAFINRYSLQLTFCEKKYNIPREIIASIIGIESRFGKSTGKHIAFNVYVSMYVKNYRKKFALSQLEELLKFAGKTGKDVFEFNSSYAGAIGSMQFLPWSLNRWFVGNDVNNMNDSILSVANYLAHFKKKRGTLNKAVFSYNPSKLYVKMVFELAEYAKGL